MKYVGSKNVMLSVAGLVMLDEGRKRRQVSFGIPMKNTFRGTFAVCMSGFISKRELVVTKSQND